MELVSKQKEAIKNIITLDRSLIKPSTSKKAKSLLKNGKIFLAVKIDERWLFAPSRFAGYRNNSIKKHNENASKDGTGTEREFDKFSKAITSEDAEYSLLDRAYLAKCKENNIIPSIHNTERKYRIFEEGLENIQFDLKASTKELTIDDHVSLIIQTTKQTAKGSGKKRVKTTKKKKLKLSEAELKDLLHSLIKKQKNHCALTNLKLLLNGDSERFPSLDRKDSNGHYEKGNLQLVCRFANRWKSDQTDEEFKRLISLVRSV